MLQLQVCSSTSWIESPRSIQTLILMKLSDSNCNCLPKVRLISSWSSSRRLIILLNFTHSFHLSATNWIIDLRTFQHPAFLSWRLIFGSANLSVMPLIQNNNNMCIGGSHLKWFETAIMVRMWAIWQKCAENLAINSEEICRKYLKWIKQHRTMSSCNYHGWI
jgi:hypothetical protein